MKRFWNVLLLLFLLGFVGLVIYNIYNRKELSHIETIILQNNTVKESVENSKFLRRQI